MYIYKKYKDGRSNHGFNIDTSNIDLNGPEAPAHNDQYNQLLLDKKISRIKTASVTQIERSLHERLDKIIEVSALWMEWFLSIALLIGLVSKIIFK